MLSLKHMQAQQQQQQALAPLIYSQHQAQATEAQLQAKQMLQDQKDEEIGGKAYNEAKGHPENFLKLAGDYGMSQRGLARARQNMATQQLALVKQHTADTKLQSDQLALTGQRHDKWADNLTAFMKRPDDDSPEGMKANWSNLLESGYRDKLSTDDEHAQAVKQYPTFPGRETVEQLRNANASQGWFAKQGVADKNQQAATKEKTEQTRSKLLAAQTPAQYAEIVEKSGLPAGTFPAFGQMFDAQGDPVQSQMTGLNRMGMTSAQRETADAAALRAKELKQREDQAEAHRKTMEGFAANRDKRETAAQHKNTVSQLADQAIAESTANGGTTLDHVLANVEDTNNYQNHPIGASRGEVVAELRKRKDAKLNTTGKEIKVDDAAAKAKMLKDAGIADTDVTGGGRGSPIVTPTTTKTPAKKEAKAAPATAAPAATPQRMKNAAGHVIEYDPKLNAWVDAETRKPVQ